MAKKKIRIKKENKGKFTAKAKKAGRGVQAHARHVLANKEDYPASTVKQANFARNAAKWKKQAGGYTATRLGDYFANMDIFQPLYQNIRSPYAAQTSPQPIPGIEEQYFQNIPGQEDVREMINPATIAGPMDDGREYRRNLAASQTIPELERPSTSIPKTAGAGPMGPELKTPQKSVVESTKILNIPYDTVWEYKKKNGKWYTKKKVNKQWIQAKGKPLAHIKSYFEPETLTEKEANIVAESETESQTEIVAPDAQVPEILPQPQQTIGAPQVGLGLDLWGSFKEDTGNQEIHPSYVVTDEWGNVNASGFRGMTDQEFATLPEAEQDRVMEELQKHAVGQAFAVDNVANILLSAAGGAGIAKKMFTKKGKDFLRKKAKERLKSLSKQRVQQGVASTPKESPLKTFFKRGMDPVEQIARYEVDRTMTPSPGAYKSIYKDTRGTLQRFLNDQMGFKYQMGGSLLANGAPGLMGSVRTPLQYLSMMQAGGAIEEPQPVQLEKGEEIIFEDQTIVRPKANKRHSQMNDYEYTDILPPATYIASRDKSQLIDRDIADNMIVGGIGPITYSENEATPIRDERTLGELFRKKRETPAKIAGRIRSKFPVTENEDIFGRTTGQYNKESRTPYTNALIHLAEAKAKEGGFRKQTGGWSGTGTSYRKVAQHQDPWSAVISGIGDLAGAVIGGIQAGNAAKRVRQNMNDTMLDINQWQTGAADRANISGSIGAGSVLGQFLTPDRSYSYLNLDPIQSRTANAFSQAGTNLTLQNRLADEQQQAPLRSISRAASYMDPRRAQQAYAQNYAQYLGASNQRVLSNIGTQTELGLKGAEAMNVIDRELAADRQQGQMYEKGLSNQLSQGLFQGMGTVGQGYLQNIDTVEGSALASKMAARNQTTSALNNISQTYADTASRAFEGIGNIYSGIKAAGSQNSQAGNIDFNPNSSSWGGNNIPPNFEINTGSYPGWWWNPRGGSQGKGGYEPI